METGASLIGYNIVTKPITVSFYVTLIIKYKPKQ